LSSSDAASVRIARPLLPQHFSRTFPSLANRNFRLLLGGLLVSGTGGWVQRIAQDWLVLTITGSPTAVGVVTAFQFVPTLLFGLHAGLLADRFPKRHLLLATQASMMLTAAALAALTLSGRVEVWHVFVLAAVLGTVAALDNPVRQSFVSEVVPGPQLPNAISLVSSTFQLGAMAGPVLGGLLMSSVGAGWAFAVNAVSFVGPVVALLAMTGTPSRRDVRERRAAARSGGRAPGVRAGLSYAARTPSVLWPVVMVGAFGFFTISLPVTLAAYARDVFHSGASGLGLLNGVVALGALAGALTTARRRRQPRLRTIGVAGAALGAALLLASTAPSEWVFLVFLAAVGAANLGFLTSAQSLVQLAAVDHLRGRVVGLYLLVFIGSGAVGGPVVGWLAESFGARTALLASGAVPAAVTLLVCQHLARAASLRLGFTSVSVRLPRPVVLPRHDL